MINLLPPDLKSQIRYAKMNRIALGYLKVTMAVAVVLGIVFAGAVYYLNMQTNGVAADVANKQNTIAGLKKSFLPQATDASSRLSAISYIRTNQTRFSKLISDLAGVLPQGTSLDTMTLTGDYRQPVRVEASATTYDQVLALRNAFLTSPRISAADIESITAVSPPSFGYGFHASLVIGFKPGEAK